MKKRMIGLLLALALTLGLALPSVAVASASYSYDAYDALLYASEHWNDGKGLCAEFVWNCVEAGGLKLNKSGLDYSWRTTKGAVQGICNAMGKEYTGIADLPNVYGNGVNEKVGPGDVIIWYNTETGIAVHVALCCHADEAGAYFYGHNPAAEGAYVNDWGFDTKVVKFLDVSDVPSKDCSCKHYYDVRPDAWYHGYVEEILDKGLMKGLTDHRFAPEDTMTRAMLVTVLWRFNWEPLEGTNCFGDIPAEQWYTEAVTWASHNGIVNGVGAGRFEPEGTITREQLAAILYRYAKQRGDDVSLRVDLSAFPDRGKVSAYAEEALSWAVSVGLIGGSKVGSQTYLDPQGGATRAQVAAILLRFIDAYGVPGASGQCGDELYWEFASDGTLTVTGSGEMWDYVPYAPQNPASWKDCAKYLKTVILPEGLTKIGVYAFAWCDELTEIRFPEAGALTRIGASAFVGSEKLSAVHIPETVTSVGSNAYTGTAFYENESNWENNLLCADGWLLGIKASQEKTELTVKEGIKGISDRMFDHPCLEKVTLPDSVIYLGDRTFYECYFLREVRLPAGIKEIGEEMFYHCWHLEEIVIPANVERIGKSAFQKCSALTAMYFLGDAPELDARAIPGGTVLCYTDGAEGWTTPYWNGYQTQVWEP